MANQPQLDDRLCWGVIICLNDPTKDLIEKVKADDQMRLFEYSISYSEII